MFLVASHWLLEYFTQALAMKEHVMLSKIVAEFVKLSDPSTNSPKPHPLLSLHSSFIPNLKHCSSTNPFLICPLLPTPLPVSTLNTIHHSRLTACLTLWI